MTAHTSVHARTAALAVAALALSTLAATQPAPADRVLVNGAVLTVDEADRVAQAVAIAGGKIVAVGTTEDILRWAGPGTERIDLAGRAVTPGLIDAHVHFHSGGTQRLFVLDVGHPQVTSIEDVAREVRAQAAKLPAGAWIEGRGWDEGKLAERRLITARDLDRAAGDHPVYLTQTTGHYGVANSVALTLAGITRDTPDPPNGTIDRYPDGTPTGVLKESAQGLVRRHIPPRSQADFARGIRELARAFNAEGMTGAKDPGVSPLAWEAYKAVQASGDLTVRVFALWPGGSTLEAAERLIAERGEMTRRREATADDRLVAGGVKLFMDGSGGARTAWLHEDWSLNYTGVDAGNRGYPAADAEVIRAMIHRYHDAGLHVSTHAIGDRAIDWVVDTYQAALARRPAKGLRHGIIHANIPTDHALAVMAELQRTWDAGYPEPSAAFTWWLGDTYAGNFGQARALRLNPFATFKARGIRWANGSDFSVTPFPARYGLWSAVTRETLLGVHGTHPFGRDEAVDVRTALRAVTIWAARQMFLEDKIGSIEVGKYADLAVWDRNPYEVPAAALKDMTCTMTMVGGQVVYRAAAPR
ncbi:MAG: amidohydrolase [Acidobacteriota bacterium]